MPQPKKGHVKYSRRIPAEWVESMDLHLKQIRATGWLKANMVTVVGDLDGRNVQVITEPEAPPQTASSADLAAARAGRAPILKPGQKRA